MRELSFRGKRESENSRFMENENPRILNLWKTRIREFSFCGKRESPFFFLIREFSFCGKRELENSRFVENQNRRIFFSFFFFHPRILVLWKTGTGDISFCGKPESENFFFFIREFSFCGKRELENSRFVENQNRRILFFWKIRIGEFSFGGKRDSENSRFVENENSEICEKREFLFCGKREF